MQLWSTNFIPGLGKMAESRPQIRSKSRVVRYGVGRFAQPCFFSQGPTFRCSCCMYTTTKSVPIVLALFVVLALCRPCPGASSPHKNTARAAENYIGAARLVCKVPPMRWIDGCRDGPAMAEMLILWSGEATSVWMQFALHYYAVTYNVTQTALALKYFEHHVKSWAMRYPGMDHSPYDRVVQLPRFRQYVEQ